MVNNCRRLEGGGRQIRTLASEGGGRQIRTSLMDARLLNFMFTTICSSIFAEMLILCLKTTKTTNSAIYYLAFSEKCATR